MSLLAAPSTDSIDPESLEAFLEVGVSFSTPSPASGPISARTSDASSYLPCSYMKA